MSDSEGKSRDELIYLARLAEQCDRYSEMIVYVENFAKLGNDEMTVDERNIFSVAFKNVIG